MDDDKIRKAEQVLGEPILPEFSEDLRRTKRNLLIVSSVSIFAQLSKIQITETAFLGFKFSSPDQAWLQIGVLSVVGYLFIQFCWRGWDYIQFSRLRITGSRVSHVTTARLASEYGDYPNDPIQSTLYNWWLEAGKRIGNLSEIANELRRVAKELEDVAKRQGNMEMANINHVVHGAGDIRNKASELERRLGEAVKVIQSARIPVSLERFDRWFRRFSKSQIARIVLLDLAVPFIFGVVAIGFSVQRMISIYCS
jgi:hypothetical protein